MLHIPLTGRDHLRNFLNEARTMRLRHPHIVPILDFGLSRDDLPFLIMEYAAGGTLHDRHPRGSKLSLETIDSYVRQLALALQYAHDRHLIHRDVKPENILAYSDGTVRLSDFGIAKIIEQSSLNSGHTQAGTPAYMAPEQSQGNPCLASDQYALAVLVYEWIGGIRPFRGGPLEVMLQHRIDPPPSLCTIQKELPIKVEQVVFRALSKAPKERFPTVVHFAQAFHAAVQEIHAPTQTLPNEKARVISSAPVPRSFVPPVQPQNVSPVLSRPSPTRKNLSGEVVSTSPPAIKHSQSFNTVDREPLRRQLSGQPSLVHAPNMKRALSAPHLPVFGPRTGHRRIMLIALLCLVLLVAASGRGIWLVITQQNQQHMHFATATAIRAPLTTATAAANAYWTATSQGVQFGFDSAHTNWNRYEQMINTANVNRLIPLWSYQMNGIDTSPAVANGLVYIGSISGGFYAFDATCRQACQPLWSYHTGSVYTSPAVANGLVYIGSASGEFYAFDAACRQACQPLWSYQMSGIALSSPTISNGIVYVGSQNGEFYAFDATCRQACQPLWSYQMVGIDTSPAVANGLVYIGSYDHKFYAFDATCRQACQPLWSYRASNAHLMNSSLAVADGVIYIGSDDHKLYAFASSCRSNCQPLWSYQVDSGINFSSPAVANGVVYIGSDNGKLYAFGLASR